MTNPRVEFLKRREQQIHAQLAAERAKSQRRAEKEAIAASKIVGRIVIEASVRDPAGLGANLRPILETALAGEPRALDLLRRKGLI